VESLNQVSSRTQMLCKKYFHEYWNQGGRKHVFMKAKQKMKKVCYLYMILIHCFSLCVFFLYVVLFGFVVVASKETYFWCGGWEEARKTWTREGEGWWCSWSCTLVYRSLEFRFEGWGFEKLLTFCKYWTSAEWSCGYVFVKGNFVVEPTLWLEYATEEAKPSFDAFVKRKQT
jgi:hypothetical protein